MYDPTIFENLKVAFENHVYDLDNLERKITITNRVDRMDFAILAREFAIQFTLIDSQEVTAEIGLQASLQDLAGEILEVPGENIGCSLSLGFTKHVDDPASQCKQIEQALHAIWENEIQVTQTLSHVYPPEAPGYLNTIEVKFNLKINEEHMGEIADFLHHVLRTVDVLSAIRSIG
ncbi:hypothetical protein MKY41_14845 [Sporosarcina sp. FSL W7-1349]|uniref:hypothetical protein n=1 Tax=Sporosarcina sp. FSL W7-1349 TaxID=2921561 RepID=UPI0030F63265